MVVIACVLIYFANHSPRTVVNELTAKGINTDTIHFPYKQLHHFWIVNTDQHLTVNFTTNTAIRREIILELVDQNPEDIREFLLHFLPEHEESHPSISQRASHFFKF
jgi:hypothetical protein